MVRKKIVVEKMPTGLPDIPLTKEAARLLARIRPQIESGLAEVNRIPVSVLLWGPGIASGSPLLPMRLQLRADLRANGHAAVCSEEICDPALPYSIRLQQLVQAQAFDLVVSIPCTPGSIAEVHDFAVDRRVRSKMLVFLNRQHLPGYSPQSLEAIGAIVSCQLEYYPAEVDTSYIEERTLAEVQRMREMKYILAGRF